ncbi:MAG: hypothetical protein JWO67_4249 [Streptosporangiaceae bacterium]|nr:hypothetical protein [Streptosporangiaceae bacterium]
MSRLKPPTTIVTLLAWILDDQARTDRATRAVLITSAAMAFIAGVRALTDAPSWPAWTASGSLGALLVIRRIARRLLARRRKNVDPPPAKSR